MSFRTCRIWWFGLWFLRGTLLPSKIWIPVPFPEWHSRLFSKICSTLSLLTVHGPVHSVPFQLMTTFQQCSTHRIASYPKFLRGKNFKAWINKEQVVTSNLHYLTNLNSRLQVEFQLGWVLCPHYFIVLHKLMQTLESQVCTDWSSPSLKSLWTRETWNNQPSCQLQTRTANGMNHGLQFKETNSSSLIQHQQKVRGEAWLEVKNSSSWEKKNKLLLC